MRKWLVGLLAAGLCVASAWADDELTRETTGVTGSSYTEWTATGESGAEYAGQSAGGNESIQLRAQSPAGIVITESSGSDVASVTVEWNDATAEKRSLEIYGSTTAYAGPADLYGDSKGTLLGTIARTDTTLEVPEGYPYIGILAKGGALYLTSVTIGFAGSGEFSVTFDKANWFEVEQGTASSVTAIARNGAEPYTYEWSCDKSELLTGTEATLAIPDTLEADDYTLACLVTDADLNAINALIGLRVVAPKAKFPVTVAEGIEHGTVTVDKEEAVEGEIVTVTATAEPGYKLDSLTYNGTDISGNTFEMPAEAVEVNATFVEKPAVSGDELTRETTGVTGSSYTEWTATGDSGAKYAGQSAGGNESIQLRAQSPAGIVITESSGSDVASVTVEWNDATAEKRSLEIYGSTTAYAGPADLYGDSKGTLLGTIARTDTTLEVPEGYPYVGILAKGGALYLTSVVFEFAGEAGLSVTLDKANGFTVDLGTADSITATAKNGVEPYTYAWTSDTPDLNGTGETLAIPATLAEGDYTVQVEVTDAESNKANKQIYFSVVAPAVKYAVNVAIGILNGGVTADKEEAEEGELVTLTASPDAGYKLGTFLLDGEAIAGNSFNMPAHDVLVSAEFIVKPVVAGFAKITSLDELTEGEYVITGAKAGESEYAMLADIAGTSTKYIPRRDTAVEIEDDVVTDAEDSIIWTLAQGDNGWTIYNAAETAGYVGYVASGKNSAGYEAEPSEKSSWTISVAEGGLFAIVNVADSTRNLRYNTSSGQERFACYAPNSSGSLTGVALALYKGTSGPAVPSVSLSASATEVEVGGELTITATAKNFSADVEWAWEGNDGGSADGAVYTVNTAVAGEFTIKATATAGDEIAEKSVTITVSEPAQKYAVNVAIGILNGGVTADKEEAEEGELVTLTASPDAGYKLGTFLLDGEAIAGNSFNMPAHDVQVSAEFIVKPVVAGFTKITSLDELTEGEYVITGAKAGEAEYAMLAEIAGTSTKYIPRRDTAVEIEDDVVTDAEDSIIWTLAQGDNGWTIYNAAETAGYVGYVASGKNSAGYEAEPSEKSSWTISVAEGGLFAIVNVADSTRNLRYNTSSGQERFACYAPNSSGSLTGVALALYKGTSGPAVPSVSLSASATEVEVGGELTITATAKNFSADVEWAWEGNDGGSADGAVYTVNTAVAGEFTIKATATAGDEIAEKSITVNVSEPGPQPGQPALVFGGDTEGTVGTPVNFTVMSVNVITDPTVYPDGFAAPEGSTLSDGDIDYGEEAESRNVSFTPDVPGDYVFTFVAGAEGAADEVRESVTITVTGEGPQPTEAGITKMTIAAGKMTIEFFGEGAQVLLSDDLQTWTPVDGAISPYTIDMGTGPQYIGVK